MALTAKERAKRYREKLKQNPAKYEAHKKKELKRLKNCQKKIKSLSEEEKVKKRQLWRDQKQKQRSKKKQENTSRSLSETTPNATPQNSGKVLTYKTKLKKIKSLYENALKKIQKLQVGLGCLRKRIQRTKNHHAQQVSAHTEENNKLKARLEIFELTLRSAYTNSKNVKDRRVLKEAAVKHRAGHTALGLKSNIRLYRKTRRVNKTAQEEIERFYLRDDISRMTAGRKECRTKKKQKKQIRYLLDTFLNLYQIYRNGGGKYSYTTFFNYKPFFVLSPTTASRNTCLCIKHDNMALIFNALRRNSVLTYTNLKELLDNVCCDTGSYVCMYNKCDTCKTPSLQVNHIKLDDSIKWYQWTRVDHNYEKSGTEKRTKKTVKKEITGKVQDLISELKKQLPRYKTHVYNAKVQQEQYRSCIVDLQDDEVLILCDFSENYECKLGQEVQSLHFGASKQTVTLHCGMIYTNKNSQSFVTVSENNCHEPHAIWAHLIPVIKLARSMNPNISVLHFHSDGPCSQYRQKKNFYLLNKFTSMLKLKYSTWSFSEAGHGKSVADGIGGAAKRLLDKRVSYGEDIVDAKDVFNILTNRIKSTCHLISDEEIKNVASLVPNNIQPVPGTMQLHQIISNEPNVIKYRELSCFCSKHEKRGMCSCHGPKEHALVQKELFQSTVKPKIQVDRSPPKIQKVGENNIDFLLKKNENMNDEDKCISFSTQDFDCDLSSIALFEDLSGSILYDENNENYIPTFDMDPNADDGLEIPISNIVSSVKMDHPDRSEDTIRPVKKAKVILSGATLAESNQMLRTRPGNCNPNPYLPPMIPPFHSILPVKMDHPDISEDTIRPVKKAKVILSGATLAESNQMLRTRPGNYNPNPCLPLVIPPFDSISPDNRNHLGSSKDSIRHVNRKTKLMMPALTKRNQMLLSQQPSDRHKRSRLATSDVPDKMKILTKKVKISDPVEKLQLQNQQFNDKDINLKPKNSQSERSKVKITENILVAGPSNTFLCNVCKTYRCRNFRVKCLICKKYICDLCSDIQSSPESYICAICLES